MFSNAPPVIAPEGRSYESGPRQDALITDVPAACPVTMPFEPTVAMLGFELVQVAPVGCVVCPPASRALRLSWSVPPARMIAVLGATTSGDPSPESAMPTGELS